MARTRSTFCCPNCFSQFQKDDSILMLSSGAAVSGEGIGWSGKLDRDIDRIKRVKYCKRCRQPLDFHALLQGKLDYHAWGPSWAALAFLLMLAASWFLARSFLLGESWPGRARSHGRGLCRIVARTQAARALASQRTRVGEAHRALG